MMQETVVGLDVHADSIMAAFLPSKSDTPEVVKLSGDRMQVRRLLRLRQLAGRECRTTSGSHVISEASRNELWSEE